jgi:Tfp pilus assembly protein PilE
MAAVRNRWKVAVSAARRDEGVADPAIVMITIVVLIVLGLTGLYFGRGFVEQARDTNAQSDLSRIAASQEFYASSANAYTDDIEVLQQGRVAFSLSTGVEVRLAANEYGWLARS